jgi:hypothetical protein
VGRRCQIQNSLRIKVITIEESKDLGNMKIEELVRSLLTYQLSLPLSRKLNSSLSRLQKVKVKNSSEEEFDDEDVIAIYVC